MQTNRPPCPDCGHPGPILLRQGKRYAVRFRTWECRACDCVWSVREEPDGDGPFAGDRAIPRAGVRSRVLRHLTRLVPAQQVAEMLSEEVTPHAVRAIIGDLADRELNPPEPEP